MCSQRQHSFTEYERTRLTEATNYFLVLYILIIWLKYHSFVQTAHGNKNLASSSLCKLQQPPRTNSQSI
ncbi:hypothetical protein BD408DRAFT_421631 [Parasitella parasitica]|nr:hypothetical protein BD408DRAFT_421631 [Parasitella parasitica]